MGSWLHPAGGSEASHRDVEVELARERADALGRAGRSLENALAAYREARAGGARPSAAEEERLLSDISRRLYGLVIQRECLGARHGNLDAIRAAYDVPEAALRRL